MTAVGLAVAAFSVVAFGFAPRRATGVNRSVPTTPTPTITQVTLVGLVCASLWLGSAVWLRSPTIALLGPWLGWFGWRQRRSSAKRAERQQFRGQLIGLVDDTVLQLRAGQPLHVAVRRSLDDPASSLVKQAASPFIDLARGGARFDHALDQLATASSDRDLRLLAATVSTLAVNGGPAAGSLERLNDTLRARRSARLESRAQSAQAMASAAVMASLPVVFGGIVALIEPALAAFYLRHPLGTVCVFTSAVLTTLGWLWIERVIGAER